MKSYRRTSLCLTVAVLILCMMLTACDPNRMHYDYNDLANNVVSVELIEYENPDRVKFWSWIPDFSDKIKPFDPEKVTVLETLDEERMPDFFTCLSEANIFDEYYVYDSPHGICLRLTYQNGDFTVFTSDYENQSYGGFICAYSSDGTVKEYIGSFSSLLYFQNLVNDFFEEKV